MECIFGCFSGCWVGGLSWFFGVSFFGFFAYAIFVVFVRSENMQFLFELFGSIFLILFLIVLIVASFFVLFPVAVLCVFAGTIIWVCLDE